MDRVRKTIEALGADGKSGMSPLACQCGRAVYVKGDECRHIIPRESKVTRKMLAELERQHKEALEKIDED